MASRYSNFPVSLYQDRSWDKISFLVWMWTVTYALLRLQYPWVCTRVLFRARQNESLQGHRAVDLWQPQTLFKLSSNHCVLLSGLPQWQTLWKPERALLRRGLIECYCDCRECFLKGWKISHIYCHSQALSLAQLVHALYYLTMSAFHTKARWWLVIDTVIFRREMKIQTRRFLSLVAGSSWLLMHSSFIKPWQSY